MPSSPEPLDWGVLLTIVNTKEDCRPYEGSQELGSHIKRKFEPFHPSKETHCKRHSRVDVATRDTPPSHKWSWRSPLQIQHSQRGLLQMSSTEVGLGNTATSEDHHYTRAQELRERFFSQTALQQQSLFKAFPPPFLLRLHHVASPRTTLSTSTCCFCPYFTYTSHFFLLYSELSPTSLLYYKINCNSPSEWSQDDCL